MDQEDIDNMKALAEDRPLISSGAPASLLKAYVVYENELLSLSRFGAIKTCTMCKQDVFIDVRHRGSAVWLIWVRNC